MQYNYIAEILKSTPTNHKYYISFNCRTRLHDTAIHNTQATQERVEKMGFEPAEAESLLTTDMGGWSEKTNSKTGWDPAEFEGEGAGEKMAT